MGSPRAHRSLSRIVDRPTHSTFVRKEPIQELAEEAEDGTFADILIATNDEGELLTSQVWERENDF